MPQRQQSVVGVFAVEGVIAPVPVKPALVRPERVDEVETRLLDGRKIPLPSLPWQAIRLRRVEA